MSAFLANLVSSLIVPVLSWTWGKVASLIQLFKKLDFLKDVQTKREEQADLVQKLSDEIKALVIAGQPVPDELKEKFRVENAKLLDISYNAK